MNQSSRSLPVTILKAIAACAPWIASMYVLYWLEYAGIWALDTPHRGKTSVIILIIGMSLSFIAGSRLLGKRTRR